MINLNNYAILAEQKKYGYSTPITESIDVVNEAAPDMQTEDGVKKVLGGKTDPNYAAQWNQLVDDVATHKAAGTYTVTINHDDNRPMVTLQYQIGTDLKPVKGSVKLAATTAQAAQGAPAQMSEADGFAKVKAASDVIQNLFVDNSPFFAPFKGTWNDEDSKAAAEFDKWYNSKWKVVIDSLKGHTNEDIKTSATNVSKAVTSILSKMRGGADADDTVVWNIVAANGAYSTYKVDTDF
jgi:hypothetical protein